jgi:hypothetical protein
VAPYVTRDIAGRRRDDRPDAGAHEAMSFVVFGSGCAGTNGVVPSIGSSGSLALGSATFAVDLGQALPSSVALLAIGLSETQSVLGPLPIALGGGCFLQVSADAVLFALVSATGTASVARQIPLNPALRGTTFYYQYGVLDPGAGSLLGIAVTAAAAKQL